MVRMEGIPILTVVDKINFHLEIWPLIGQNNEPGFTMVLLIDTCVKSILNKVSTEIKTKSLF